MSVSISTLFSKENISSFIRKERYSRLLFPEIGTPLGVAGVTIDAGSLAYGTWAGHEFHAGETLVTFSYQHGNHGYKQSFYYGANGKLKIMRLLNVPGCN